MNVSEPTFIIAEKLSTLIKIIKTIRDHLGIGDLFQRASRRTYHGGELHVYWLSWKRSARAIVVTLVPNMCSDMDTEKEFLIVESVCPTIVKANNISIKREI